MNANQQAAMQWAQKRLQEDFVIIDLETSGWGKGFKPEIVQIGIVSKAGDVLLDALVRPMREIQAQAVEVHGITPERVARAATFNKFEHVFYDILHAGHVIIAYNAEFDRKIFTDQLDEYGFGYMPAFQKWSCAMLAYAQYHGEWNQHFRSWKYQKLVTACKTFDVDLENAHSAAADALATLRVIEAMANVTG